MIKNLVKHGNSWAIVIDRPILDILKIDLESPLAADHGWEVDPNLACDQRRREIQSSSGSSQG